MTSIGKGETNLPRVLLVTCGRWHLDHTATALGAREALAGFYLSDNDRTRLPREKIHRCWRYHVAMKGFYHLAPQIVTEKAGHFFHPLWRAWIRAQKFPPYDVVHATMGNATEAFDDADRTGALRVVECPNSHPVTYRGHWQGECDRWCPGEKIPVPGWLLGRMAREIERADVVLCPSLFVRDSMIQNGVPPEKCFLDPFGVDTSLFQPRQELPAKPRFISVGTICVRKGFPYLFRAFEQVKNRLPEAELIVVSGYKVDFRMERPKWEGTFTHIERADRPTLAALLATCTAFVLPSIEEGFARVIPEAMASGLPIIATHESGATTLVKNGLEGVIVPARDVESVAAAMIDLALDRDKNIRMGRAAHERATVRNTWQDYVDRLLAEYAARLRTFSASIAAQPR